MSILHIVGAKVWGGGEQYVYDMCDELQHRGLQVYTLVDVKNGVFKERLQTVSKVLQVNLYRLQGLFSIQAIARHIKDTGITSIHCHSGKYILLCIFLKKLTGVKLFFYKHNVVLRKEDKYHRWIESQVDRFICVSKCVYDAQVNVQHPERYVLLYNGVNARRFPKIEHKKILDTMAPVKTVLTLGYAGRIEENKGVFVLLEAVRKLVSSHQLIQLKICGDGTQENVTRLKEYIATHHLESYIQYMGFQEDINHFYRSIDCLVAPSIVKEAFGLVLCEAMYCEDLVIASRSGAQHEIIEDGVSGILLEDVTIDTIYNACMDVVLDPTRRAQMALQGNTRVTNHFTIHKMVDTLCEMIE